MISKVEELREALNEHIVEFGATLSGDIEGDIDALISAACAEADSKTLYGQLRRCHDTWIVFVRACLDSIGIHMKGSRHD